MAHYEQFDVEQDSAGRIRVEASMHPERMFPYAMAHAHTSDTFDVPKLRAAFTEFCDRIEDRQRVPSMVQHGMAVGTFIAHSDGQVTVGLTNERRDKAFYSLGELEKVVADAQEYAEYARKRGHAGGE